MEINKSADSTVEFFGIRGIYVPYAIGGSMGIFILFLVLQSFLNPVWGCLLSLALLLGGIQGLKHLDRTYGDRGMDKVTAQKIQPPFLRHTQVTVFEQLIKPSERLPR